MFLHDLKWYEVELNIIFTGNCIDRDSCLPVLLGIILISVRIILNSHSLYYDSIKEPWTEMVGGRSPLVVDLGSRVTLLPLRVQCKWQSVKSWWSSWGCSSSTIEAMALLHPCRGILVGEWPVLVCAGRDLQKPPTPGVLQACIINWLLSNHLITLASAQSGRRMTRIFLLWIYSERPSVTSLLLTVMISNSAVLLSFAFCFWSIVNV